MHKKTPTKRSSAHTCIPKIVVFLVKNWWLSICSIASQALALSQIIINWLVSRLNFAWKCNLCNIIGTCACLYMCIHSKNNVQIKMRLVSNCYRSNSNSSNNNGTIGVCRRKKERERTESWKALSPFQWIADAVNVRAMLS